MPLVASDSMEHPAKLCTKACNLGDGNGTSSYQEALIRLAWLRTASTQLVTPAAHRW